MRKLFIIGTIWGSLFLGGCNVLEEVNSSLDYANKATEHINTWNDFGQKAPQLIKGAATNEETKAELEKELNTLLEEINKFNNTEAPAIAESVHQQIVEKNEAIKEVIENAMVNGELAIEKLENSELMKLINEVTSLMNVVEKLGG
ncbi:DUF6376 family protein [Paenisporosarcina sp. TG20]|uniref:DUF6376 family protein n=1 Tax=Paenisporosarcina sp. TG20 TaxID=1211706 RepID=UPI0002F4AFD0|nr:DUF6376 family protein [Paenisporosarcina sp. TG20]